MAAFDTTNATTGKYFEHSKRENRNCSSLNSPDIYNIPICFWGDILRGICKDYSDHCMEALLCLLNKGCLEVSTYSRYKK